MRVEMVFDDGGLGEALERAESRSRSGIAQAVYGAAALVRLQVQANAASASHMPRTFRTRDGRQVTRIQPLGHIPGTGPGPNVATGNYKNSIQFTPTREGGNPVAYVHTNSPQARRLEYGFRGTDSLGRRYNQPPYPHWQPAADQAEDILAAQIQRVIDRMTDDLKGKP